MKTLWDITYNHCVSQVPREVRADTLLELEEQVNAYRDRLNICRPMPFGELSFSHRTEDGFEIVNVYFMDKNDRKVRFLRLRTKELTDA